jgi:hypothetical protein
MNAPAEANVRYAHLKWCADCAAFEAAARRFETCRRKYNPAQPRDAVGRWADIAAIGVSVSGSPIQSLTKTQFGDSRGRRVRFAEAPKEGGDSVVAEVLRKAKSLNLTASPADYQKCLNICYPILERPKRPGSDINKYDFHRCMSACLGINR